MKNQTIALIALATLLTSFLAAASEANFNCSGVVCGGAPPYSGCGNVRVSVYAQDEIIEGHFGGTSFNSKLEKLKVSSRSGIAYVNGQNGSVTFKTFPSPQATIRGFGFTGPNTIECRVYRFQPK